MRWGKTLNLYERRQTDSISPFLGKWRNENDLRRACSVLGVCEIGPFANESVETVHTEGQEPKNNRQVVNKRDSLSLSLSLCEVSLSRYLAICISIVRFTYAFSLFSQFSSLSHSLHPYFRSPRRVVQDCAHPHYIRSAPHPVSRRKKILQDPPLPVPTPQRKETL